MMQLAGMRMKIQLIGQKSPARLTQNSEISQTLLAIGDTPEKSCVGREFTIAAKKQSSQLTYLQESSCISICDQIYKRYKPMHFIIPFLALISKQSFEGTNGLSSILIKLPTKCIVYQKICFNQEFQAIIFYLKCSKMNKEEQNRKGDQLNPLAYMKAESMNEKRMEVAGKLSSDLLNMLELEIESNKLQVNEVQKGFKLKQKPNDDDSSKRINDLLHKKQQIQSELDQIALEEQKIHNLSHSRYQRKYFKSQLTEEDIEKTKKLKMQQKKYQQELQQRAKMHQEHMKKLQEEERELLQKQKKEKNEQRLKEVAKKIEEIKKRQEQRTIKIQEQNKKILEIKHEKKLHQKLEDHYKSLEQEEQRKKQEIKLAMKVQKKINFDDIKQHEKKYSQIMRGQRQEREKKLGQFSKTNIKKYPYGKIIKQVLEQQEKSKKEHIQRIHQIKQKLAKKEEYAQYVRNTYLPSMPLKQEKEDKDKSNLNRSVSVMELHAIGNQYMKSAHQNLVSLKGSSISKLPQKKEEPFKYKDYLKDMKVERKHSSHRQSRYLEQIDNLMKNENMTQQQKFHKAKMVALKLEDNKGQDSQKMINSINAKIRFLQQIDLDKRR